MRAQRAPSAQGNEAPGAPHGSCYPSGRDGNRAAGDAEAEAFSEPSAAAQAGASTTAGAIVSHPACTDCGRVSGCCRLSMTVTSGRWKLPTALPGKTHPRDSSRLPQGWLQHLGHGKSRGGGHPGASWLSRITGTLVLQPPEPGWPSPPAGTGQRTPKATHSTEHPCSLLGPLYRKPLTQPAWSSCGFQT